MSVALSRAQCSRHTWGTPSAATTAESAACLVKDSACAGFDADTAWALMQSLAPAEEDGPLSPKTPRRKKNVFDPTQSAPEA